MEEAKDKETEVNQDSTSDVTFQFFCHFCGDSFGTLHDIEEHIDAEHEETNDKNEISLNENDNRIERLITQLIKDTAKESKHQNVIVHKCQFCDATFLDRDDFERHVEEGHDSFQNYSAPNIEKTRKITASIVKTGKNEYICPFCNNLYRKHYEIMRHILNSHKDLMKNSNDETGIGYMFSKCDYCDKMFKCESELAIHRNRHTKEVLYRCPYCTVETLAVKDTFQHMKRMHKDKAGAFDKNSVIRIQNSKACATDDKALAVQEENFNISMENKKRDPTKINSDLAAEDFRIKVICTKPVIKATDDSNLSKEQTKEVYKCPYCSFVTHYSVSVKKHVQRNHETFFETEGLETTKHYQLNQSSISPDTLKSIPKLSEVDFQNVTSYFQCQFCSYKCISKSHILRHLNSNRHAEEKMNGEYENLDISKLRIENKVNKNRSDFIGASYYQCPFCSYKCSSQDKIKRHLSTNKHAEQRRSGDIDKLDISTLKIHPSDRREVSVEMMDTDDHERQAKLNTRASVSKEAECLRKTFELIQYQPFIRLEKMKQPVQLHKPRNDIKFGVGDKVLQDKMSGSPLGKSNGVLDKVAQNIAVEENLKETNCNSLKGSNVCPYCKFQCSRASALKFHINFNHQKDKLKDTAKETNAEVRSEHPQPKENPGKSSSPRKTMSSTPKNMTDTSNQHYLRSSSKKSVGKVGKSSGKQFSEAETPKGKMGSGKRKPDVETDNNKCKKSNADAPSANKRKKVDSVSEIEQTWIINKDGTVIMEDNLQPKKFKQEPVVELSLSEITDESNESEVEDQEKAHNKRISWMLGKSVSEKYIDENDKQINEIVLFVCPYCKGRFKGMKSVKTHISVCHPKEKNYKDEIEIVIEEYEDAIAVPADSKPAKSNDKYYKCPFCPKYSQQIKTIKSHIEALHKDKSFAESEIKEKSSDSESDHELNFCCPFCNDTFESKSDFQRHVKNMHEGKNLKNANTTVANSSISDDGKEHKSVDPESSIMENRKIEQNKGSDGKGAVFGCPKCALKFKLLTEALQHLLLAHGGGESSESKKLPSDKITSEVDAVTLIDSSQDKVGGSDTENEDSSIVEMFKCPYCDMTCELEESVKEHIRSDHDCQLNEQEVVVVLKSASNTSVLDPERFQCPACPLQLRWKHSILKHARKYHPSENITSEKIKPVSNKTLVERYFCPYCSVQFKWRNSIPRHVGRVHQDKINEFTIDLVEARMVSATEVEVEDEADTEGCTEVDDQKGTIQICECPKCPQMFGTVAALQKHNITEHGEKGIPYKCWQCPKSFLHKHQWMSHVKMHEGSRNTPGFKCDQEGCSKSYTEKKELYKHLRREHGEKDPVLRLGRGKQVYMCNDCDAAFNSRVLYWRHCQEKHNRPAEKLHECKVCSKAFFRPHDLKDHMFVHMSTADLQCPIANCLFKTKKLKYLAEHIGRQHNIKIDSKSLGKHVLSEKRMSAEELNLFPTSKLLDDPATNEATAGKQQDNAARTEVDSINDTNGDDAQHEVKLDTLEEQSGEPLAEVNAINVADTSGPALDNTELPQGKRYTCQLCHQVFPTHRQLIKHKVAEHIEELEVYRCDKCRKTFFTIYDLKEHTLQTHPTSKDHVCSHCGKSFAALSYLQKHQKRHQEVPVEVEATMSQVICDVCGIPLRYKASLLPHIRRAHPEMVSCPCSVCTGQVPIEKLEKIPSVKYCNLCDKYFCTKIVFQCHMRGSHNTTARHTCNFCPEVFSTLMQMKTHMHQAHSGVVQSENTEVTDGELTSTTSDTHHVIEISNEESKGPKFLPKLSEQGLKAVAKELKVYVDEPTDKHWKCLLCGSCFSKVKYFNMHVRRLHVRAEHQPFRCKLCGSGFARVAEFRKHTRTHSGFRPLTCHICNKSFKQQCHLKEHLLIHGTNKQYKCEICQRRFKQRGALLAHVIRHDKLKPFKCHFCGVGFTIRWSLSRHMKKYLEADQPGTHLCHICQKTFQFFPLLLKHIQSHQEPHPWSCEVCNKTFAAYTSYYDHKCKMRHFLESDFETLGAHKAINKGTETTEAVDSLMEEGITEGVAKSEELDSGELVIEANTEEEINPQAVEIVIQDQGNGEHTTYKVEGHTDVDILSIAKQLTEMSGSLAQDIYIEEVSQPNRKERNEEEEKIMMTMLDADEEVKSSLEKALMAQKMDTAAEQNEGNFENRYIQILQTVSGNNTAADVAGNYVVIDGNYVGPETEEMEIDVQRESVAEILTEVMQEGTAVTAEGTEIVDGYQVATSEGLKVEDLSAAASQRLEVENGMHTDQLEIDNDGSVSVENPQFEPEAEKQINTTAQVTENQEFHVIVSSNEQGSNAVVTNSDHEEKSMVSSIEQVQDGQETQVEYAIIGKDSTEIQTSQAESIIAKTESCEPDMYEPPLLQTECVSTVHIQSDKQEDGVQSSNLNEDETSESVETHNLIPVSIPEFGSQPMYMFKKADGSLVYICLPDDQTLDNTEIINAALEADVYLEEQTNRDDSTLEAAQILKSVASGSSTSLEQAGQADGEAQAFQVQISEDNIEAEFNPNTVMPDVVSEADLAAARRVIKNDESAESTIAYQCSICHSLLKSKKNFRHHLKRHAKTEDRAFECSECGKRFVSNSELNRHMRVHTDFRPCECEVCGKKFRQPGHLMAHRYTHTGEKPYACRQCPCKFTTSTLLRHHTTKHSNLRPFKCEFCERAYKTMRELTMHRAVHSGLVGKNRIVGMSNPIKKEAPQAVRLEEVGKKVNHICHICGKEFLRKLKLQDHLAAHENLRNYICDVCGLGFNTKSAVDSHAFSHIDERPEICENCGGAFKTKKSLRAHQKNEENKGKAKNEDPRYQCFACDKRFKSRSALYYHIGSSSDCMKMVGPGSVVKQEV